MIKLFNQNNCFEYQNWLTEREIKLDIYYYPEILEAESKFLYNNANYEIFTFQDESNFMVYPYLLLPIPVEGFESYHDLCSPYGYTGPYFNTNDTDFLAKAEEAFVHFHKSNKNTITEFVRYHYLYNEQIFFKQNIVNNFNRSIVTLNLQQDWNAIWEKEFSAKNRNLTRRLMKDGYLFEVVDTKVGLKEFYEMYIKTMDNASASEFYYFDERFFNHLVHSLNEKIVLTRIIKDGITYSCALFLCVNGIVTYYFSARNLDYPKISSGNFLLSSICEWAYANKYKIINFGGGTDATPTNSLLEFKKNFSSKTAPFYIGKRIHNAEVYQNIISVWQMKNGVDAYNQRKNILQFYR